MKKIYVEYKNNSYEFDLSIKFDDFKNQITERIPQLRMNKFEIVFCNQNNYQILQEKNYNQLYNNYRCYKVKISEIKDLTRSQVCQSKILDNYFPNQKKNDNNYKIFDTQKNNNNIYSNSHDTNIRYSLMKYEKEISDLKKKIDDLKRENNQLKKESKKNINNLQKAEEEKKVLTLKLKNLTREKEKEFEEKKNELNKIIEDLKEKIKQNEIKNEEENKKNIETIIKNKEELNKYYENNIQTMSNQLKEYYENEFKKFQQSFLTQSIEFNTNILKNQKKKFYQIIEENNKSFKEDEIQTLEEENKKIIHEGYECINCKQNPIIGNRYNCEFCLDYNLCEECYNEKLKGKIKHNHKSFNKIDEIIERKNNIIMNKAKSLQKDKIKTYPQSNQNKYNNKINECSISSQSNKLSYSNFIISNILENSEFNSFSYKKKEEEEEEENIEYSYKVDSHLIEKVIEHHTSKTIVSITLINNCKYTYKKDITKLICDESISDLICKPFIISPLKTNQSIVCFILFENLKNNQPGEYYSYLNFMVGDKIYGEKIKIKIIIVAEKKKKLIQFRKEFSLSSQDYNDEYLLLHLEKNNFNFNDAFNSIFNDN